MSDTPRTDAVISGGTVGQIAMRQHAEQLERELASVRAEQVPPIAWAVQWEWEGNHGTVSGMHLFDTEERARHNQKDVGGKLVPLYASPPPHSSRTED